MIASTSTLFLATLVFGAASVVGAPVRISDTLSESVARAVVPPTVEPVARAIVDVQDHRRRSNLGAVSRRAARVVYERDEPFAEIVTAREPVSVVTEPTDFSQRETIQRRYPRRHIREFYEKREPASTIKETTMVVSKTTVHDTPADAAAFNAGAAVGSANQPAVSGFTVKIPLPVVGDGSVQASTSTLLSVSSATTITASSGTATSTATSSGVASDASATATSAASSTDSAAATATASVSASSTDSASATSTATSTDTASAAAATTTGTADSTGDNQTTTTTTTSVVSADQPAASGAATDGTTSTTTTTATGDDKTADNKDAVVAAVVNGGSGNANADNNKPAITVNGLAPAGAVASTDQSSRRSVKVSTSPIARRTVARSGASWASWARRQMSSVH